MFKTGHLYQNDEQWKRIKLGSSPETIGEWGGLLTSVTMMLNGIGYKEETPKTVNEIVKKEGGFQRALLIPSYLSYIWPNCAYLGIARFDKSSAPTLIEQIDAAVAAHKPVILQVRAKEKTGTQTHFVLVKDKKGDDYVLYDPYRYEGDAPDKEVLLTTRYASSGAKLESAIGAVLWFDFHTPVLSNPPKVTTVPVPQDKYTLYAAEDGLVLRASPSSDSYPRKCLVMGTELICLESKGIARGKLGVNGQWIRVQDPNAVQGYVAAWFVNSINFPALSLPQREALPSHKKWCLKNVLVENPRFETWYFNDKTILPYYRPGKAFKTLLHDSVVHVLASNQIIPGDDESSSWSGIAYQKTHYDSSLKKWVTTRVTGWIKDEGLEDYCEHPDEQFRKPVVCIPRQTENSTDAQQYLYIDVNPDEKTTELKARYNMCGELCIASIVQRDIDDVLDQWRRDSKESEALYNSMVGKADKPLGARHIEDLLRVHVGPIEKKNWERYKVATDPNSLASYIPLAAPIEVDPSERSAHPEFQGKLKDYYFITNLKIDTNTGDLKPARSRGECNHWVVLDKITRNGTRVELYNPYPNRREEYSFGEFYRSVGGVPNSGWWVKKDVNPTFAKQKSSVAGKPKGNRDQRLEETFQAPRFEVPIDNPTPDLRDAEQYIKVEGLKKTNLCGEFCVSFILMQSMENALRHWTENRPAEEEAGLPELITWLDAYGFINRKTKYDQSQKLKTFSIDTILKYWKVVQPELYNSILGGSNNEKTGPDDLKTILRAYGYVDKLDFIDGGLLSSPGKMAEKLRTHFFITGVTINGNKGGRLVGSIPHWVVVDKITPIGNLVGGNGGWVELYNPFLNRWEEYSYREFMDAYNGGGLWVARDITPTFTRQRQVGAKRKEKGSQKNARSNNKKQKEKKAGKPAPTQNELVKKGLQKIKDGESLKSVTKALAKQLDLSMAEAARLLGPSEEDDRSAVDVEALMCERFDVDSMLIPPELERWLREKSQGDDFLVEELIDALLEFGILSVDVQNKKCELIDLKDPALSRKIEDALHKEIDQVVPASQQTLKIARAIGPVFAFRVIEEIKSVQAKIAEEKLKAEEAKKKALTLPRGDVPTPAYRVMWDWEMDDFEGSISRPNLPAVFRCGKINDHSIGHYVWLTEEWQYFWFDLCSQIYYGKYHQDLTSDEREWFGKRWTSVGATTTAFTNQHGLDKFRNYILREKMDSEDPKIYTLVCGGASLAGTPVEYKKGKKRHWMLKVAHFDGNRPPPPVETIDPYTDPRVFFATTIRNKRIRGRYCIKVFKDGDPSKLIVKEIEHGFSVNRFPQFHKDGELLDCPVPLVAYEDIYFPMKYLVPFSGGIKVHPYFPE